MSDVFKLARPIVVPVRQTPAAFFAIGPPVIIESNGPGDDRQILYMIDGLQTRDVRGFDFELDFRRCGVIVRDRRARRRRCPGTVAG